MYELSVLTENHCRIAWETSHAQTANKLFKFTVQHKRTIDSGTPVLLVSLKRDNVEIKGAVIAY